MSDENENPTQGTEEAVDQDAVSENSDAENQTDDDQAEQDGLAAGAGAELKPFNPLPLNPLRQESKEATREEQAAYGVIKETAADLYDNISAAMMQEDVGDKPVLSQALNHLEYTMALVSTGLRCK